MDYDESQISSRELVSVEAALPFREPPTVSRLNIYGLHDPHIMEKIGNYFGIHPLSMEDILHPEQRPKMEVFENYLFLVLKMVSTDENTASVNIEQISIILGENFVITFQKAGRYHVYWQGKNELGQRAPSGIYIIRLKTAFKVQSQKVMLVK